MWTNRPSTEHFAFICNDSFLFSPHLWPTRFPFNGYAHNFTWYVLAFKYFGDVKLLLVLQNLEKERGHVCLSSCTLTHVLYYRGEEHVISCYFCLCYFYPCYFCLCYVCPCYFCLTPPQRAAGSWPHNQAEGRRLCKTTISLPQISPAAKPADMAMHGQLQYSWRAPRANLPKEQQAAQAKKYPDTN
jgi:hypothetical protein